MTLKVLFSRTKPITSPITSPLGPQIHNRTEENFPWEAQKEGGPSEALARSEPFKVTGPGTEACTHPPHAQTQSPCQRKSGFCPLDGTCTHTQTHYPGVAPPIPHRPDLADAAAASASKNHGAALVVIGSYSSQAIILVHKKGCALDGDRAPQWLVEVLPTEVVIDLQGL